MIGLPDAPPARGVPERDILRDPIRRAALVADLNRDLDGTGWHAWEMTDSFRIWASRVTGGPGRKPGKTGACELITGCGEARDADNPAAMRLLLEDLGVVEPEHRWLSSTAMGALWRVKGQAAVEWAKQGKLPEGSFRRADDGTWQFREDVMHQLLARAVAEAAA